MVMSYECDGYIGIGCSFPPISLSAKWEYSKENGKIILYVKNRLTHCSVCSAENSTDNWCLVITIINGDQIVGFCSRNCIEKWNQVLFDAPETCNEKISC